jgi:prolyl oligopeptidase
VAAKAEEEKMTPAPAPAAPKGPQEMVQGVAVADPYRWLETAADPKVQEWMKTRDTDTRKKLADLPGRAALAQRLHDLLYVETVSAPVKRGGRFFYERKSADQEKAILYWRRSENGEEKVLLDPNTWSDPDHPISLGIWVPSWNGKWVAFAQRPNAADEAVLHVVNVDTGRWSKVDVIQGAKFSLPSWTPDNRSFYYEWSPVDPSIPVADVMGFREVRLHRLGRDPHADTIVHPKTGDPTRLLEASISRDGKYLFVTISHGWAENDIYWKRVGKGAQFKPLVRGKGTRYAIESWKDQFYIYTDEGAPNGHIFRAAAAKPERQNWVEVIPEEKEARLQYFYIIGNHLVLHYLTNAYSDLRIAKLDGTSVRDLTLPGLGTVGAVHGLEDEDDAYFAYSSFVEPTEALHLSVKSGEMKVWAKSKVPIRSEGYEVEQVWYPSKDGTRVSMFVVHRKGWEKDGQTPAWLTGYGGFDVSLTPVFGSSSAAVYLWLESGGVFAVANLRGGGEYGSKWHEAGMRQNKQNVFDDFIAAAEYLVKERYTQSSRLVISGGSNGGLLVGAAVTQRPELFGAVVCANPLLDMVRYHLFGLGKAWIPEYGSADNANDFKFLYAYSPYHHLKVGVHYPPLLMMSADEDDRVDPLHARKFVAAFEDCAGGSTPVYLRIEKNSGHQGADLVKQRVGYLADQLAFMFHAVGVSPSAATAAAPSSKN